MKKSSLTFILISILAFNPYRSFATTMDTYFNYNSTSNVNDNNLNGNFNSIRNVGNGGLDNTNAATTRGFRFYEVLSALPLAGTPGRIVFLTSNNLLYFDNGTTFVPFINVTGTPSTGNIIYYNGAAYVLLATGTNGQRLILSNGAPSWGVNYQIFTANGTFTAPAGISTVYVTMCGGGGGGGGGGTATTIGGGGGGAESLLNYPFTVVGGTGYSAVIGQGGAGGGAGCGSEGDGSATTFSTLSVNGGKKGACGNPGAGGAASSTSFAGSGTTGGSGQGFAGGAGANAAAGAGGGGGASFCGAGGAGGNTGSGTAGAANTGAGGGGGGQTVASTGGAGGSGRVIVMY